MVRILQSSCRVCMAKSLLSVRDITGLDVKFSPHGWRLGGHALNRNKDLLEDLSIDEQSGETFLAPGRGLVGWISSLH
jgi:hypothetical protein